MSDSIFTFKKQINILKKVKMIQITQLLWVMSLFSTTNCSVYVNSYA